MPVHTAKMVVHAGPNSLLVELGEGADEDLGGEVVRFHERVDVFDEAYRRDAPRVRLVGQQRADVGILREQEAVLRQAETSPGRSGGDQRGGGGRRSACVGGWCGRRRARRRSCY